MIKPSSRTVPGLLDEIAARNPHAEFLVDGPRRSTYENVLADVEQCAKGLLAHGITAGDRIGILAGNRAEWLIANFAAMSVGAIAVGLNTWSSANELAYQLEHSSIRLLFVESQFRDRNFIELVEASCEIAAGLVSLEHIVVLGEPEQDDQHLNWSAYLDSALTVDGAAFAKAKNAIRPEDVACLLYTSGSTALPKGVPLLHQGLVDNMWEIGERQHLVSDDRLWLAVSLFWSLACVNALYAVLTHGGSIVLQHHFDADEALALIEKERCSVFYGTPNMALAMSESKHLAKRDISSLRTGVTIGTPPQISRVVELGVEQICNVYGLTEAYGNSTVTDSNLPLEKRIETVGRALSGVGVRIVAPSGEVQASDIVGEIQLHGNVTPGYWNDVERTAESFSDDGWFRTGDLGLLDEQGYLYYRGRLKEMVKTGGINVAPAEVEQVLSTHTAIELVFVTGIPDERFDEALAAVIVFRKGHEADETTLRDHCRQSLAPYKTPRHFRFVNADELPLTSTGKLQRNRLGEFF